MVRVRYLTKEIQMRPFVSALLTVAVLSLRSVTRILYEVKRVTWFVQHYNGFTFSLHIVIFTLHQQR